MRKIASTKWICKWLFQIAISLGWNLLQRKQSWFVHLDLLEMPCIFYKGKLPCSYVIFTPIWILVVFFPTMANHRLRGLQYPTGRNSGTQTSRVVTTRFNPCRFRLKVVSMFGSMPLLGTLRWVLWREIYFPKDPGTILKTNNRYPQNSHVWKEIHVPNHHFWIC